MRYHREQGYSPVAIIAGWIFAALYIIHQFITVRLPRTDKLLPLREELRGYHYTVGTLLLITALVILYCWFKDRPVRTGEISASALRWTRMLAFVAYSLLILMPLLGFVNAWTHGLPVHFGPLPSLPALMDMDRNLWVFSGYFHTAPGFSLMLINLAVVITAGYTYLRYGAGLITAFPPGYGFMSAAALGITVYALSTFKGPENGPTAVGIYLAIIGFVWGIGFFLLKRRAGSGLAERGTPGLVLASLSAIAIVAMVGLGLRGPYVMFRVNPFHMAATVEAPEDVTFHQEVVARVEVTPETDFEREVAEVHFKWCGFCHTFEKGKDHLLGPNLYGIFGQEIATVPNFPYTEAMVGTRAPGRVWTDELLMEYLSDPDKFAPGTSMVVSSGNVTDPEKLRAMVNILKKRTMGDAIIVVDNISR